MLISFYDCLCKTEPQTIQVIMNREGDHDSAVCRAPGVMFEENSTISVSKKPKTLILQHFRSLVSR